MDTEIRRMEPGDLGSVLRLIAEFAEFESLTDSLSVDKARLSAALFDDGAFAEGLVAESGGTVVGYALFFPYFASFRGERGLYLEDLYISPASRGGGLGKRMLASVAARACERGFERLDFLVLDWNTPARDFYASLGGEMNEGEIHYKFTGEALKQLAKLA